MSQKIMFSCFKEWYRNFMKKQQITSAMEANRCAISAIDCDDAKEYLEAYQELQEKDAASGTSEFFTPREGLLVAAIISYSRAFTNSHGGEFSSPKAKINLGQVFNNDRSKIDLHKLILKKRHKVVAHSDGEYRRSRFQGVTKIGATHRQQPVVIYGEGIDITEFISMAEKMGSDFRCKAHVLDISEAAKYPINS